MQNQSLSTPSGDILAEHATILQLSAPQAIYLDGLNTKYRSFVGGFGSGKTFVGCLDLLQFAGQYPGYIQAYYGPTYPLIKDVFYPTLEEAAELLGFQVEIQVGNHEVDLYRGGYWYGKIICRSMGHPGSIVGYKVVRSLVDELDTVEARKAKTVWRKIIARQRMKIDGVINDIGVTTTPEGFGTVYSLFADNPLPSYSMVQASTYENEQHLPDDYIPSMLESYPAELVAAYCNGQFVNLTSGSVYKSYNRVLNNCNTEIEPGEPLYIGMDFNVQHMAGIVHVKRNGDPHAVAEFIDLYDTPDMITAIQNAYPDHDIYVYPDASGKGRHTIDALKNDLALLEAAGFTLCVDKSNPRVKARVTAMNTAFCNAMGERRYKVNAKACPKYAQTLEQQVWADNGEPDKTQGHDHPNDAGGYFIAQDYPVIRPSLIMPIRRY